MLTITAGTKAGLPFELLPWLTFCVGSQFGWVHDNGRLRFNNSWWETGKGQAKALALDTPIPTPSGWRTMGSLREGDSVFDERGCPCHVMQVHEVLRDQECFRVTFDDGATIVCDAGHLWMTETRKSGSRVNGEAMRGVKLAERGKWRHQIRTTAEIARTRTYPNGPYQSANHSIALTEPLQYSEKTLPIDPYVLGFWLGDGDSDGARVTISDRDAAESLANLRSCGMVVGSRAGKKENAGRYRIVGAGKRGWQGINTLSAALRRLGVMGNKHVPRAYLEASIQQRTALLQGLMDTDGTICGRKQCSFSNTRRELAEAVFELALSLGLKATINTGIAKISGREIGLYYRVNFYAPANFQVFRLTRKQSRVAPTHSRRRLSGDRKIVGCERVSPVPVRCISVDSSSQMYLAGRQMIPTHNSPGMAAVGLYLMGYRGIPRAEIYAIAWDKDQANVLFKDGVAMCRAPIAGTDPEESDTLENRGEVVIRGRLDHAWRIEHPGTGSKFQSLANGDAISGPRPTAVLADEIHEFKNADSIEIWKRAIAKMPGDALMLLGTNTPASTQIVGSNYSEFYQKIVKGEIVDDTAFAFIARVDKDDKPFEDEACWSKALPALGITFPVENIRREVNTAKLLLSTKMSVGRLYFGIPLGSVDFWIAEEAWAAVQGEVVPEKLKGRRCWLSLDLSDKNDLTALTVAWEGEDGHLYLKTWYWTTKEGLHDRALSDNAPYELWEQQKFLTAIDAPIIDKAFVAAEVKRICGEHDVQFLAFDPAGIDDFIAACDEIGFAVWRWKSPKEPEGQGLKLVSHAQGTRVVFEDKQLCMPRSIERFEDRILAKTITIDSSPVTYACAANAKVVSDAQNNRAFDKRKSRGRIDGLVTCCMATGAATVPDPAPSKSFWDTPDAVERLLGATP